MTTETEKTEPTKPEAPEPATKKLYLSKMERLSVQHVELQRQLMNNEVERTMIKIDSEASELAKLIQARLGIDLAKCKINVDTGEVFVPEEQAAV